MCFYTTLPAVRDWQLLINLGFDVETNDSRWPTRLRIIDVPRKKIFPFCLGCAVCLCFMSLQVVVAFLLAISIARRVGETSVLVSCDTGYSFLSLVRRLL